MRQETDADWSEDTALIGCNNDLSTNNKQYCNKTVLKKSVFFEVLLFSV